MYSLLKSKKISIQNQEASPLLFCQFLNNEKILLISQDKTFTVISIFLKKPSDIIYQSKQLTKDRIIDCKRVYANTCAVLTDKKDIIIFIQFTSKESIVIKQMPIQHAALISKLSTSAEIIDFKPNQFVVAHQSYEDRMMYLYVLTRQQNDQQFHYSSKIFSHQIQLINCNFDIFKPLKRSGQFAIYQQKQLSEETQWRMKFISLNQEYQQKIIDLNEFLTQQHLILEIMVKDSNQYYLFTKKIEVSQQKLEVWRCRLHGEGEYFAQSCQLLTNYLFDNTYLIQIVTINYQMGFFITKNYAHQLDHGEAYDNTLQIVNLQTGGRLEKLHCNVKYYDVSLSHEIILDYSQEINSSDQWVIHLRTLLNKKKIYHYFLHHSKELRAKELSNSFQSLILQSL